MLEEIIKLLKTQPPTPTMVDWLKNLPDLAKRLEVALYHEAANLLEYLDHNPLKLRLVHLVVSRVEKPSQGGQVRPGQGLGQGQQPQGQGQPQGLHSSTAEAAAMKPYLNREAACTVCGVVRGDLTLNNCLHVYCVPCRRAMETDCTDHRCPVSMCGEELCGKDEAYGRGQYYTLRMMALLESGGVASAQLTAELEGLNELAFNYFHKANDRDIRDIVYYIAWQMEFRGEHESAANTYLEALSRNKSDCRVLQKLIKLYLKVSLPSAALHHCESYHAVLVI